MIFLEEFQLLISVNDGDWWRTLKGALCTGRAPLYYGLPEYCPGFESRMCAWSQSRQKRGQPIPHPDMRKENPGEYSGNP
jgi:hypothetical protein